MTLYEKIRSMTIEEMATFLSEGWHNVDYEDGDYDLDVMTMLQTEVKQP